jgi:carbamoyltransferase
MSEQPIILGVNSAYHESSACVLRGSEVLAIAEEERFNRTKHAKPADVDTADQVPATSIRDVMRRAGVTADDIDHVAYSFDPELRRSFDGDFTIEGSWGSPEGERTFLEGLARVPAAVGEVLGQDVSERWVWVGHEVAHAASAYYASPFADAAVLSIDGIGEHGTGLLAHGRGSELEILQVFPYPHSLGFVWEKLSKFVGLDEYSAPKLMALAAFASDSLYHSDLDELMPVGPSGFEVDSESFRFRVEEYGPLEDRFGPRRREGERIDFRDAAVASALQHQTEKVLLGLAEQLKQQTGSDNLCLAGGVALNCVAMGRLLNEGPFDGVFVQPLAHDGGGSVGAALWVAHNRAGVTERWTMEDPYLGPSYDDADIEAALEGKPVEVTRVDDPAPEVARAIADGLIVGWFNGPAEVGPRALGARSILGDPRKPGTKELINLKAKHREYFRPFAPSALEEHVHEWFVLQRDSLSERFMSFAVDVQPDKHHLVPAILHVDGTSRVQAVSAEVNPRYHALISEFHRLTGVPLVLNTSFNTYDEPIVCSPEDALRTFLRTDLDMLVLQNYIVRRPS